MFAWKAYFLKILTVRKHCAGTIFLSCVFPCLTPFWVMNFFFLFVVQSHVAQASLKLPTYLRRTLNSWSFCLRFPVPGLEAHTTISMPAWRTSSNISQGDLSNFVCFQFLKAIPPGYLTPEGKVFFFQYFKVTFLFSRDLYCFCGDLCSRFNPCTYATCIFFFSSYWRYAGLE